MARDSLDRDALEAALAAQGLILRGGFHPEPADELPALPDGQAAASLILIGNAGPALWQHFAAAPEHGDGAGDPMNRWTARVVGALAEALGALALYPFGGPPYWPFIAWAKRCEPVAESPLGLLIHPDYGLWHAYRAALLLPRRLGLPARETRPLPCESCAQRPCLGACPVGAFTAPGYDVGACAGHLQAPEGADCMAIACRARRACPAGAAYVYEPAQAAFHMAAFLDNRIRGVSP